MWIGFAHRICDLYYDHLEEIVSKVEQRESTTPGVKRRGL
jgi:hypothetical protein